MGFTIPNSADAAFSAQAEPDAVDFAIMTSVERVVSGCAVTAQSTPNMTVAVASGTVLIDGAQVAVTAGNVTITTADTVHPRFDLIVADSSGTLSAVAGTPASEAVFPAVPSSKVALASVYVPANATTVGNSQIVDKRVPPLTTPLPYLSGQAYTQFQVINGASVSANSLYAICFYARTSAVMAKVGLAVQGADATHPGIHLGVYADNGSLYPGALLADDNTASAATSQNAAFTAAINVSVTGGKVYWLAVLFEGTPVITRAYLAADSFAVLGQTTSDLTLQNEWAGYRVAQSYGALPSTFPGGGTLGAIAINFAMPLLWAVF